MPLNPRPQKPSPAGRNVLARAKLPSSTIVNNQYVGRHSRVVLKTHFHEQPDERSSPRANSDSSQQHFSTVANVVAQRWFVGRWSVAPNSVDGGLYTGYLVDQRHDVVHDASRKREAVTDKDGKILDHLKIPCLKSGFNRD
jgi:hypothetical protein